MVANALLLSLALLLAIAFYLMGELKFLARTVYSFSTSTAGRSPFSSAVCF